LFFCLNRSYFKHEFSLYYMVVLVCGTPAEIGLRFPCIIFSSLRTALSFSVLLHLSSAFSSNEVSGKISCMSLGSATGHSQFLNITARISLFFLHLYQSNALCMW
jgi:hypothetical protein